MYWTISMMAMLLDVLDAIGKNYRSSAQKRATDCP